MIFLGKMKNTNPEVIEYVHWLVDQGFDASYDVAESIMDELSHLGRNPHDIEDIKAVCSIVNRDIDSDVMPTLVPAEDNGEDLDIQFESDLFIPTIRDIADSIAFANIDQDKLLELQNEFRANGYDVSFSEIGAIIHFFTRLAESNGETLENLVTENGGLMAIVKEVIQPDLMFKNSVEIINSPQN